MPNSKLSFDEIRTLLQTWRDDNVRRPEDVIQFWEQSLSHQVHKLGDEKWVVYEQVCMAALDLARLDIIQECVHELDQQFPGSLRVRKLKAMNYEVLERYDEALKIYDSLLEADDSNCALYKRKIAVLRSQNKIPEAIKQLTEYLKKFVCDQEGWAELCQLYQGEQEWGKAGFCMEELILASPHNHLYLQQYADILYTADCLDQARPYYAQALKLCPDNLRALYGLYLTSVHLAASSKTLPAKKKEHQKLAQWCSSQLVSKYQDKMCDDKQQQLVQEMLASLQIS